MAIDSTKATLAVKRRLACEMVKYWQQVRDFSALMVRSSRLVMSFEVSDFCNKCSIPCFHLKSPIFLHVFLAVHILKICNFCELEEERLVLQPKLHQFRV